MIAFRHTDTRFPFLWEGAAQPAARWHDDGDGAVHYLSDTPDGAWAEFLRHEEITDPEDVATIRRALWAIEIPDGPYAEPRLPVNTLTGGRRTYPACRAEARRLRDAGAAGIVAVAAALPPGEARGWRVHGGLVPGPSRDAHTIALFGRRTDLVGWAAAAEGRPRPDLVSRVRPLSR